MYWDVRDWGRLTLYLTVVKSFHGVLAYLGEVLPARHLDYSNAGTSHFMPQWTLEDPEATSTQAKGRTLSSYGAPAENLLLVQTHFGAAASNASISIHDI
jgi:hypothetical protein